MDISLSYFDEENFDPAAYDLYAIVDSQKNSGNNPIPEKIIPDITFDHHNTAVKKYKFYDIKPQRGATSTIVLQYYLREKLPVTKFIATCYCYALHSETKDLQRNVSSPDFHFYYELYKTADPKILSQIRYAKKPLSYIETLKKALNNYKIREHVISVYLGDIVNADFIPEIADILIDVENVYFSIVVGKYQKQNYISCRTTIENCNLGDFLTKLLKKQGKAGGHSMLAAGQFQGDPRTVIKRFTEKITKVYKD